jgi:hypothetical protein
MDFFLSIITRTMATKVVLDFEKPIVELETKLNEMRESLLQLKQGHSIMILRRSN